MNWKRLKDYRCPKDGCGATLFATTNSASHACPTCGFLISKEKFESLLRPSTVSSAENFDNFEALQNLGHDLITEDFSDSPYADRQ